MGLLSSSVALFKQRLLRLHPNKRRSVTVISLLLISLMLSAVSATLAANVGGTNSLNSAHAEDACQLLSVEAIFLGDQTLTYNIRNGSSQPAVITQVDLVWRPNDPARMYPNQMSQSTASQPFWIKPVADTPVTAGLYSITASATAWNVAAATLPANAISSWTVTFAGGPNPLSSVYTSEDFGGTKLYLQIGTQTCVLDPNPAAVVVPSSVPATSTAVPTSILEPTSTNALPPTETAGTGVNALPLALTSTFYRAVNLGGAALVIDSNNWEANTNSTPNFSTNGSRTCNQYQPLMPPTDANPSTMIRCSREHWEHDIVMSSVPNGSYQVSVYVWLSWDDPHPAIISLAIEGTTVVPSYNQGPHAGEWDKLGPFTANISDGTINITTAGGVVDLSGIEVWRNASAASATPTRTRTSTPTNTPRPVSATPTKTPTITLTNTRTWTPTNTPTNTAILPSFTPTDTPTNTAISPSFTPTETPTNTTIPPSFTPTDTPTNTAISPSFTPTDTPTNTTIPASGTPTKTPTNTSIPPSATPTRTPTNTMRPPSMTPTRTRTPGGMTFYRAINLGGEALVIDGHNWEANTGTTLNFATNGDRMCNQYVTLTPPTDANRATMIRCYRQHWAHNIIMSSVPTGTYQVWIYVWQDWDDPDVKTYSIAIEGNTVVPAYTPGPVGRWDKLGPFSVNITDNTINITTQGELPDISGIEVWRVN